MSETKKVLVGKIQIIDEDLTALQTKKSAMKTAAGFGDYDEVTENLQYVNGCYSGTFAYYDTININTTPNT